MTITCTDVPRHAIDQITGIAAALRSVVVTA